MKALLMMLLQSLLVLLREVTSFEFQNQRFAGTAASRQRQICERCGVLRAAQDDSDKEGMKYRNQVTQALSKFLKNENQQDNPLDTIDWNAPKIDANKVSSLETLAQALDAELCEKEWFVTGRVNPVYFSDAFSFQDPDVKLHGIEDYARGVYKLFDQSCSRAEIISTVVNATTPHTITCTWRLSGKVSIGPAGLTIKPYVVYTDFTVDPASMLVTFQEDRFDLPSWDILLSAFFPFLNGKLTAPPAPPVEARRPSMPQIA